MPITTTPQTCDMEPFRYQATPQPEGETGSSANQINEQALEDYLSRLKDAVCADMQTIFEELAAIDERLDDLEAP